MKRKNFNSYILSFLSILAILWLIAPFYPMIRVALQSEVMLNLTYRDLVPPLDKLTLWNFSFIINRPDDIEVGFAAARAPNLQYIPKAFFNSIIVANLTTFGVLLISSFSAYSISRLKARWTNKFLYLSLGSRLVPLMTLMVPLYMILRNYRLLNSLTGVILCQIGFLVPYGIWILANYFDTIPMDLENAARIDGCTRMQTLYKIILPLSAPGLASCGVIIFILSWNELVIPLIINTDPSFYTIPVILAGMIGDMGVAFPLMMATTIIAITPSFILVLVLRKFVVQGLIGGALKG